MKIRIIINDAPYGSERMYNGLRLAGSLAKHEGTEITVFLIGDAVSGAHRSESAAGLLQRADDAGGCRSPKCAGGRMRQLHRCARNNLCFAANPQAVNG